MTPLQLHFVDNAYKHGVTEDEIWDVFLNQELPCLIVKYKKDKPDKIYNALGGTEAGRYLVVGFVRENASSNRIIHAIDMKNSERKYYKRIRRI